MPRLTASPGQSRPATRGDRRDGGDPVHRHDFHATTLHLLGIDHERLTFRFQSRDFRLTDVSGSVVKGILG